MSGGRLRTAIDGDGLRARAGRLLFGDRVGLAVFLAAMCLFTVLWIVAWRINDSLTLMNALAGMSDGHLYIETPKYSSNFNTPGTHQVGEHIYGRNYGILFVSLLPLAALEALALVADLRIALVGLFSLGLLALAVTVGRIVDRPDDGAMVGGAVALVVFVGNVAFATNLDPASTELYALQVTHMVVAGLLVVLAYRLLRGLHGRRAGLFGAALVALGTPVGLWATVPKRHVITAALALFLSLCLLRSREAAVAESGSGLRYRLAGYAAIGLFAWVHAPEALLVLLVFAAVDLPTGRTTLRALGAIAVTMAVATIPFLVTNYLISGSPATPPRMLPQIGASTGEPNFGGGGGGGGGGGSLLAPLFAVIDPMVTPLLTLVRLFRESLVNLVAAPGEVVETFLRSGYLDGYAGRKANYEAVNLAVLESAPILAATLGVIPVAIAAVRRRGRSLLGWPPSPARTVDAFLVLFSVAFALLYTSRLPIHAQITVRYVLPIFPTLVVLIVRLPAIRGVLADHWRLALWTYAAAVFIGGQLLVAVLALLNPGVGEAFQFHALLALAIAGPLGLWSLAGRADGWWGRAGAVLIGLATAAITGFLLLLTLDYFTGLNAQALPLVRVVGEIVSFV